MHELLIDTYFSIDKGQKGSCKKGLTFRRLLPCAYFRQWVESSASLHRLKSPKMSKRPKRLKKGKKVKKAKTKWIMQKRLDISPVITLSSFQAMSVIICFYSLLKNFGQIQMSRPIEICILGQFL